ncbi:hypothetical protein HD596_009946 [Nonomuraea jabiensis]|uniref:Uncharacterized protein n=1 Tax=Nonomuraea jabiensis TaxID=882448 RepID=A0A7W9LGS5_9ACTN|nr:hypothetical protein [Nonomuraea jabiensis]
MTRYDLCQQTGITHVSMHELVPHPIQIGPIPGIGQLVENRDQPFVKAPDEMRADEPGSPGYQNAAHDPICTLL